MGGTQNNYWMISTFSLLERLSEKAGLSKDLGKLHLDSHALYRSLKENIKLMVEATDLSIYNFAKTSPSNAVSFSKAAKLLLVDLRELYRGHSSGKHSFF